MKLESLSPVTATSASCASETLTAWYTTYQVVIDLPGGSTANWVSRPDPLEAGVRYFAFSCCRPETLIPAGWEG